MGVKLLPAGGFDLSWYGPCASLFTYLQLHEIHEGLYASELVAEDVLENFLGMLYSGKKDLEVMRGLYTFLLDTPELGSLEVPNEIWMPFATLCTTPPDLEERPIWF